MRKNASPPQSIDRLTAAEAKVLLLDDQRHSREWFSRTFAGLIRETAVAIARLNNEHRSFSESVEGSRRAAIVVAFTHTAFHSLVTSAQLLISGYPVPSGHMMRQYAECSVMALMCAVEETGVYAAYDADPQRFEVHKSMDMLSRKSIRKSIEGRVGFSHVEYLKFVRAMKFFDKLSHASPLVIGHSVVFSKRGGLVIGSHFDTAKRREYKKSFQQYGKAASMLEALVRAIAPIVPTKPKAE